MTREQTALVATALILSVVFASFAIVRYAHGGEKQLCHLEPSNPSWSYRTKVDGRSDKCWYEGAKMKPRRELYWAESPGVAPIDDSVWQLHDRWRGSTGGGWDHKE